MVNKMKTLYESVMKKDVDTIDYKGFKLVVEQSRFGDKVTVSIRNSDGKEEVEVSGTQDVKTVVAQAKKIINKEKDNWSKGIYK